MIDAAMVRASEVLPAAHPSDGRRRAVPDRILLGMLAMLVLLIGTAPAPACAQASPHRVWAALGIGGGSAYDGGGGVGPVLQLVYERAPHHFALRGIALTDLPGSDDDSLGELGVLYGRVAAGNMGFAAASAGISAVYFDRCDTTGRDCLTVGIPVVVEFALTPLGVLGIGVQAFANINPQKPYTGAFIIIPFGWMP